MVVLLVVVLDAAHHGQRISNAGFLHPHGLEPALQRLVLLDILAVLVEGGGTDDLDLAAGEGGFRMFARRFMATLLSPAEVTGVDLVNEQDDVARRLDLAQQALDPLLELAAELVPATRLVRSSRKISLSCSPAGTCPLAMRSAMPSAMAVLPTPASPMRQGLFFWRRLRIWMVR